MYGWLDLQGSLQKFYKQEMQTAEKYVIISFTFSVKAVYAEVQ